MDLILWIAVGVLAVSLIAGLFVIMAFWRRKKKDILQETNYRTFFITGIVMLPIGLLGMAFLFINDYSIVTAMPFFTIGLVYLAIGWSKRETWKNTGKD